MMMETALQLPMDIMVEGPSDEATCHEMDYEEEL